MSRFVGHFEKIVTRFAATSSHRRVDRCFLSKSRLVNDTWYILYDISCTMEKGILYIGVKNPYDLVYSLNLLVLLLPVEHRCTLEALLNFLKLVIENQASNKMSIHNVAMIVAPSLFPPRYIHPRDHTDLTAQVNMAAICCQVTEALLNNVDKLWYVPTELVNQLQRQSEVERYRKYKKKYY